MLNLFGVSTECQGNRKPQQLLLQPIHLRLKKTGPKEALCLVEVITGCYRTECNLCEMLSINWGQSYVRQVGMQWHQRAPGVR